MRNRDLMAVAGEFRPRWASAARFLVGLAALAGVASACTEAPSPPGYREYMPPGGSGGGGTSAAAGTTATSGSSGDAEGGAPEGGAPGGTGGAGGTNRGGSAGSGGKGGQGGGGSGGSGGSAATSCGNGTKEDGEECDDGNLLDFDGCSSVCTSKCEDCLDEFYGADFDYKGFLDFYRNSMEPAIEGPALGQPRSKLAQNLVRCIVQSECFLKDPIVEALCFCGTVSNTECEAGMANGPCVKEFGEAAEGKDYATVSARLSNTTLGVGWAVELLKLQGSRGYCTGACKEKRAVTSCERCKAGDQPMFDPPQSGCTACLGDGACLPALQQCVEEKCADGNVTPCLGEHDSADEIAQNGLCKESVAAAKGTQFSNAAMSYFCTVEQCKDECFGP